MNIYDEIMSIFPEESDIPPEFNIITPFEQSKYLVNGELHSWNGPLQDVFSLVYIKTPEGLSPKLLGRYPILTEKESLSACP